LSLNPSAETIEKISATEINHNKGMN